MTAHNNCSAATEDELCVVRADRSMLGQAIVKACDLLAERIYGNPARSPGHNARIVLERALAATMPGADRSITDDAQGTVESAREYVEKAIASYAGDPADNQFQKGFLAALEVVRDEAFTAPVKDDLPLTEVVAKLRAIVAENGGLNYEVEHNQCSAASADDLLARAQAFVDRKYVARADARQKSMGLAYVEAERQDLAREIVRFVRSLPIEPQSVEVWQPIETAPKDKPIMLCVEGFLPCVGRWWPVDSCWASFDWEGHFDSDKEMTDHVNGSSYEPTHWKPLPAGPSLTRPHGN